MYYDKEIRVAAMEGMREILRRHGWIVEMDAEEMAGLVEAGLAEYKQWRTKAGYVELGPEAVWRDFVFRCVADGQAREAIAAAGEELARHYEGWAYRRRLREGAVEALRALKEEGLRLAVVSNMISRELVAEKLEEDGIASYFEEVVVSSRVGLCKPNPGIFVACAKRLGVEPRECVHVGDTVSRDVVGAKAAGYGMAVLIRAFLTARADDALPGEGGEWKPDAVIEDLRELPALVLGGKEGSVGC